MTTKRHFETFDALRFLAFLKVFLYHALVYDSPLANYLRAGAHMGVYFFFVLSGFLITYIIAEEQQQTGQVNVKHFLARRFLRIWPLYYLMVAFAYLSPYIISFLGLARSDEGYKPELAFSIPFLENYKAIIAHDAANASPLPVMWSVCVEEHFYIIWGLLLYFLGIRWLPRIIPSCVIVSLISRLLFVRFGYSTLDLLTNLDFFAAGAVPAYLLITRQERFERLINSIRPIVKWYYILLVVALVIVMPHVTSPIGDILSPTLFAVLFSALLSMFLPQTTTFQIGGGNVLSKLGKYTYAMYLFHTVLIRLLDRIVERAGLSLSLSPMAGLFFVASLALTILASMVSYSLFERPFLGLKKYFY
jgi:peptidoglycan/LPS O-acetylase OafA/YrhL